MTVKMRSAEELVEAAMAAIDAVAEGRERGEARDLLKQVAGHAERRLAEADFAAKPWPLRPKVHHLEAKDIVVQPPKVKL